MNKKIYDQKTNFVIKTELKEVIYSNFELLAVDIADILIILEQKYKNKKMLLGDEFSDELAFRFDNILNKRLNSIITDLQS